MASQDSSGSPPPSFPAGPHYTPSYSYSSSSTPPAPPPVTSGREVVRNTSLSSTPPSSRPSASPNENSNWDNSSIDTSSLKTTKKAVDLIWSNTYGAWGRVSQKNLLTYAHLLVVISAKSEKKGYQEDVRDNVKGKTFGTGASHNGFQNLSYIKALNVLIQKGVSLTLQEMS
jgi:hypothetical protein